MCVYISQGGLLFIGALFHVCSTSFISVLAMGDKELDVDQFRNSHESSTEWRLRRQFLLAHRDKFTVDRLLCLASCYVNVECYGNRYPDPVMRQLRELKADLPRDNRECFGKST